MSFFCLSMRPIFSGPFPILKQPQKAVRCGAPDCTWQAASVATPTVLLVPFCSPSAPQSGAAWQGSSRRMNRRQLPLSPLHRSRRLSLSSLGASYHWSCRDRGCSHCCSWEPRSHNPGFEGTVPPHCPASARLV